MVKYGVYDNTLGSFTFNDECEGLKEEEIENYYRYPKERAGSGDEAESDDDDEVESMDLNSSDHESDHGMDDATAEDTKDDLSEGSDGEMEHGDDDVDVDERIADEDFDEEEIDDEADGLHEVDPAVDVDPNIHHEVVSVPSRNCPFTQGQLAAFKTCIEDVHREGHLPHGYGVRPEEWEDGVYPEVEQLPIGGAQRCKLVHLPNRIWMARSVLWTQALCLIETYEVL